MVPYKPTRYETYSKDISRILLKEGDAKKIFLNVSSSTKLCAIAFALSATEYDNVFLYYVVPKTYNLPTQGRPLSTGVQRVEVFSPRIYQFGDLEDIILRRLARNSYASLGELN